MKHIMKPMFGICAKYGETLGKILNTRCKFKTLVCREHFKIPVDYSLDGYNIVNRYDITSKGA